MVEPSKQGRTLPTEEKNLVVQFLLQNSHEGQLRYGAQREAEERFGVNRRTVYRLWNLAKQQLAQGQPVIMQARISGYTHKDKFKIDKEKVKSLSVLERSSIRKMAGKLAVSKSLLGEWIRKNELRPHTNAIKPSLTQVNKLARLKWCLSHIGTHISNGKLHYKSMHNVVHIDEKWFYISKCSDRYYLLPEEEEEPYRHCKSKRYITKVMFIAVVARPHIGAEGQSDFDGKIGIFPFTTQEPAQRASKNRAKGTLETKPTKSITKAVIKECLIQKVILAIQAKWPSTASKNIVIQQDNVKPHITARDKEFTEAATRNGFSIMLQCQPANSPDTNVLDLGFFRAIQSLQDEMAVTVDDLVNNVCNSFNELSGHTLNKVFITLQGCLGRLWQSEVEITTRSPT